MVNTEDIPSISITLKPLYYRPLKIPSAMRVLMQSENRGFTGNKLFFPVTSPSGSINVCMNNNRIRFHSNVNQRERQSRQDSTCGSHNPNVDKICIALVLYL